MARQGESTGKVALVPEFELTVKACRARGTAIGNELASQGTSIVIRLGSDRDHVRAEAWKEALEWYRSAKNFLAGGR